MVGRDLGLSYREVVVGTVGTEPGFQRIGCRGKRASRCPTVGGHLSSGALEAVGEGVRVAG